MLWPGQLTRFALQTHGDEMRKNGHSGILSEHAITSLESEQDQHERIVIDGIRNVAEIEHLRDRFGNRFFLFALECPVSDRWERLRPDYEKNHDSIEDFRRDDLRDQNEDLQHGQAAAGRDAGEGYTATKEVGAVHVSSIATARRPPTHLSSRHRFGASPRPSEEL